VVVVCTAQSEVEVREDQFEAVRVMAMGEWSAEAEEAAMGDIWVHVRMKECCRATLRDLDKRKKKARFEGGVLGVRSLFEALGEKTIDEAKAMLANCGKTGGKLEELTRAACVKVCEKHAAVHKGQGETEESVFWHQVVAAMQGKSLSGAD
jgi:hypothetical protein